MMMTIKKIHLPPPKKNPEKQKKTAGPRSTESSPTSGNRSRTPSRKWSTKTSAPSWSQREGRARRRVT